MPIPLCIFDVVAVHNNDPFLDIDLADNRRKGAQRSWRLSFDGHQCEWYAYLLRAEDAEAEFDYAVQLPDKVTDALIAVAMVKLNP